MQQSDISAVSASQSHKQMTMNNPRLYFSRKQRLLSLDVFRGISVLLMIFVNHIGPTWPILNTSPWNGLQLGDIIQPFFLYAVGISIVLSMNKYRKKRKTKGFTHAIIRFIKLFIIGLLTEGGKNIANYNIKHLRIFGILQRIAICYIFCIILELYLEPLFRFDIALTPTNSSVNLSRDFIIPKRKHKSDKLLLSKQKRDTQSQILSPSVLFRAEQDHIGWNRRFMQSFSVFRMYQWHWVIAILLLILYCVFIYGIATPNIIDEICGRDILNPACNAVSYVDKQVLGENHMYFPNNSDDICFQRMRDCSSCYPGKCPKENREPWCDETPFEPYGIISTTNAIVMTIFGMHIGHLFSSFSERKVRIFHLISVGIIQGLFGILLDMSTYNLFNSALYSVSYLFLTCGLSTVIFSILYFIMDSTLFVYRFKKLYGTYQRRQMAKRHLTNYYVSPQYRNEKIDKLYQYVSSQLIADVIEEHDEYKDNDEFADIVDKANNDGRGKINVDNSESKSVLVEDNNNKPTSILTSNKSTSILTSNKSSMLQSLTGSDRLYQSEFVDSEDIDLCCPWWCCCCCEDLPCTRWDWSIVNIMDKLIFMPLESLGRNAFLIYIFAVTNVSSWFFSIFYWNDTKQCLTNIIWPNGIYYGPKYGMEAIDWRYSNEMMLWTVAYCLFWICVAVFLHHKKWYYVI
eukprot:15120_1